MAWVWTLLIWLLKGLDLIFHWFTGSAGQAIILVWFATLMAGLLILPVREVVLRRRNRRDRAFADGTKVLVEAAVEIVVEADGRSLGSDRGVVWFDRGLLGFTGERTSFLLAYEDFIWPGKNAISWIDVPFQPLKLNVSGNRAAVAIHPMWGQGRAYRRGLKSFIKQRIQAEGERQWPPLTNQVSLGVPHAEP